MVSPIRLGIIGAGQMGAPVARTAAAIARFEVTAIADPDRDRSSALAEELGAKSFTDAGALLASGLVDAVYIGVPHHLHLQTCLQAAATGVHGLVDKPLCNTDAEAQAIETALRESATVWMVGFSYRFRAEWRAAREIVAAGRIGDPVSVIDVIVEAAATTPAWYWDPDSGGGVLQLQSHHCFDRLEWMLGRRIREITCRLTRPEAGAAETAVQIAAVVDGGALAGIALSFAAAYSAQPRALFVLQGTRGQVEISFDCGLTVIDADGRRVEDHSGDDWLARELLEFADAVDRGQADNATIADGRRALRCALAAAESAAMSTTVSLR